jgi:hypothetical protein
LKKIRLLLITKLQQLLQEKKEAPELINQNQEDIFHDFELDSADLAKKVDSANVVLLLFSKSNLKLLEKDLLSKGLLCSLYRFTKRSFMENSLWSIHNGFSQQ